MPARLVAAALLLVGSAAADDAGRGADLIFSKNCIACHALSGTGGDRAPDLAQRSRRGFSPTGLVASFWNHGPAMWQAMADARLEIPKLDESEIKAIYAYFHSIRYFDPPGDAGQGKRVFERKRCLECHDEGQFAAQSQVSDPSSWARQMWNHAEPMSAKLAEKGIPWPRLSTEEMVDLVVYLRAQTSARPRLPSMDIGASSAGRAVFVSHSCAECHTLGGREAGKFDLSKLSERKRSMAGFTTAMWNHRPDMAARARELGIELKPFSEREMSDLLGYLMEVGLFDPRGSASRGRNAFRKKGCASCHDAGTAPELKGGQTSAIKLAVAVWTHGPEMLEQMRRAKKDWPNLTGRTVADLIAYLNER